MLLIREAHFEDARSIAVVHVDTWRTTYAGIVPEDALAALSYPQREAFWGEVLQRLEPRTFVLVADMGAEGVVGFVSGGPEREHDEAYRGEVYAIYIMARYQRKGLGSALMISAGKRLLEADLPSMLVWVLKQNPARRFYGALGGAQLRSKLIELGDASLEEIAYAWKDIHQLIRPEQPA
ncbi:MAG TPA: GNAT family N-acetyltransferase [Anaerolineales bacterium]|nr:GNAT family N-acetyltransferase [Anaerolineales bacterium]